MNILSVATALPPHRYDQQQLSDALRDYWQHEPQKLRMIEALHANVMVGTRHLAMPIAEYYERQTFGQLNDAYIRVATDIGEAVVRAALDRANLRPRDVDAFLFVSTTGIATPSIDARIMNRIDFSPHVRRVPLFGLGCAAGAAGLSRAADLVADRPRGVALLLSVELCSLTLQRQDLTVANLIASGLFGDGASAVVIGGADRLGDGPRVVASRSVFYPNTEGLMGWSVSESGLKIVLSADVPGVARTRLAADIDAFLGDHSMTRRDMAVWVCHPGGPRVIEALEAGLGLTRDDLAITWKSLAEVGNLSSSSVLFVLHETLAKRRPPPGSHGMLLAMGPGFSSELVLLGF